MFGNFSKLTLILFTTGLLFLESVRAPLYGFTGSDTLQIHGFASQAFIQTSENRFFGDSKEGSFDFTELGLNASIRPIPDLRLSIQILSRRAGEGDKRDLQLDYGLLDYNLISNTATDFGFRLGRVKNPLGFYNDTRDVAFTRPSILLPQSIYFDRTRNLALSSDGIHFYSDHRTKYGNFFYELGMGYPDVDDLQTKPEIIGPQPGGLDERLSYVGRLLFEKNAGKIRLGVSGAIVNFKFEPVSPAQETGRIRFIPLIFSAQYNSEFWSLTSEYALRYSKYRKVGEITDFNRTGESYYLQGAYRFYGRFEALLRYDVLYQDRNDRRGDKASTGPKHSLFAKDWTAGLRWDITKSWMSRIEYHYVDGTAWLPILDNPVGSKTNRYWQLFTVLVSYRF